MKETAGNKTLFAAFAERPGYAALREAVEGFPDILDYLRSLTDSAASTRLPQSRIKSPGLSSKSVRGLPCRFTPRPSPSPAPSLPVTYRSSSPAARFQSRREPHMEITPGPQAYHFHDQTRPLLGTMSRETRLKDAINTSIGPGCYEPHSAKSAHGFHFAKDQMEAGISLEDQPGPGHYDTYTTKGLAFSIAATKTKPVLVADKLGPGSYELTGKPVQNSVCRFASAPRFPTQGLDYVPRHRILKEEDKIAQKRRIEANMNLNSSRSEVRKEHLEQQSLKRSVKMEITRMARSGLLESTKWRRKQALEDKFQRYEWRVRIEEVREVQKNWFTALICGSLLRILWVKCQLRKELHRKSCKYLRFLTLLSKCIGVIRLKTQEIRLKRAYSTLKLYIPRIKRWVRSRKDFHRQLIASSIEQGLTQELISQLLIRWQGKLRVVQRAIRSFLRQRRLFYIQGKMSWALTEISLQKNTAKSRTFATEYLEGRASIPEKIKEYYIRLCVQKKLIRFFYELRNHRKACAEIRAEYAEQHDESSSELEPEAFPPAPVLSLGLSQEEFKQLVLEAEKNRLNWDKIQHHVEQPLDRRRLSSKVVIPYGDRRKSKQEFRARSPTVN